MEPDICSLHPNPPFQTNDTKKEAKRHEIIKAKWELDDF